MFMVGDGRVISHFLDSGSFTLKTQAIQYGRDKGCSESEFYDSPAHWQYLDDYATFVKQHGYAIDLYANVDVIPDPDLSYRNQRYLETNHGLSPVPVVHCGTDLDWLDFYVNRGRHEVIGIGGLVGYPDQAAKRWLDRAFSRICKGPDKLPCVKLHGFGVSNFDVIVRYPWWSVDSSSWTKIGGYGGVVVPPLCRGEFSFQKKPRVIMFSNSSPSREERGEHYDSMGPNEQRVLSLWLQEISIPLGEDNPDGSVKSPGVRNNHPDRRLANVLYFERLSASLPEWPWPFRCDLGAVRKGFGMVGP